MAQQLYIWEVPQKQVVLYVLYKNNALHVFVVPPYLYPGSINEARITKKMGKHQYFVELKHGEQALLQTLNNYTEGSSLKIKVTHLSKTENISEAIYKKPLKVTDEISYKVGPLTYIPHAIRPGVVCSKRAQAAGFIPPQLPLQKKEAILFHQGAEQFKNVQWELLLKALRTRSTQLHALPFWFSLIIGNTNTELFTNMPTMEQDIEAFKKPLNLSYSITTNSSLPGHVLDDITPVWETTLTPNPDTRILFEHTALGACYDVNQKQFNTDLRTFITALETIFKHVLLTNVGGRILVDLPSYKGHEAAVYREARRIFARDHLNSDVLGVSKSGLLEIVRPNYYAPNFTLLQLSDVSGS